MVLPELPEIGRKVDGNVERVPEIILWIGGILGRNQVPKG
jgi:hypothetical protein